MKKENKKRVYVGSSLIIAFAIWTILVKFIDVRAIGPRSSNVGFSKLNEFVHSLTGNNMILYTITDWLGIVPVGVALGFAIFGLVQWIKRKIFLKVDFDILALGGFYIVVMAVYILFEIVVINYRPVLINGYLEASYPSSTTMLVMCVMPSAIIQLRTRIKNKILKDAITVAILFFIAFMVIGRVISGVHWISDIIGGALVSVGLVTIYSGIYRIR